MNVKAKEKPQFLSFNIILKFEQSVIFIVCFINFSSLWNALCIFNLIICQIHAEVLEYIT